METLCGGIGPGGVFVLAGPSLYSLKGMATKLTPYRLHVWYYRHVFRRTKEEGGPYPTFMPRTMSAPYVRRFLEKQGLKEEFFTFYESRTQSVIRTRWPLLRYPWAALRWFLWLFGHDLEASDWMGVYTA